MKGEGKMALGALMKDFRTYAGVQVHHEGRRGDEGFEGRFGRGGRWNYACVTVVLSWFSLVFQ